MNLSTLANRLINSATVAEILLWEELKEGAMGWMFYRQYSCKGYLLDFYCPDLQLAIEIGNTGTGKEELKKAGIHLLQFSEAEIQCHILNVLQTIRFTIRDLEISHVIKP